MYNAADVVTPAINTALAVRRARQEVRNMKATEKLIEAQEDQAHSAADANSMRAYLTESQNRALQGVAGFGQWSGDVIDFVNQSGRGLSGQAYRWLRDKVRGLTEGIRSSARGIADWVREQRR